MNYSLYVYYTIVSSSNSGPDHAVYAYSIDGAARNFRNISIT